MKNKSANPTPINNSGHFLQQWPQLVTLAQQSADLPYQILLLTQVEEALSYGEYDLAEEGLLIARLDLVLAGLWAELAADYFNNNQFSSRLQAAADILLAARTDLEQPLPQRAARVQLLLDEALLILQQWNILLGKKGAEQLLYAAEEAAQKLE